MNLCTLFDSNYLDRGLVLCDSLNKTDADFTLYIFTFDERAYEILYDLKISNVILVKEEEILDEELRRIKEVRSRAEYCWTCTPVIIQYVLEHFKVRECTYIDADMCFYASPQILMDEIVNSRCSVSMIEHRFPDNITKKTNLKFHGKYCVEFNTFFNDKKGKKVLDWWKSKCIESCSMKLYEKSFGDQKYLEEWIPLFGNNIYEIQNLGAGVAPWNIVDYKYNGKKEGKIIVCYKDKKEYPLIFYHFQNLRFIKEGKVNISVYNEIGKIDKRIVDVLYDDYIEQLKEKRNLLDKKYHLNFKEDQDRKKIGHWKYTGVEDLVTYIISYVNCLLRGKKNLRKI